MRVFTGSYTQSLSEEIVGRGEGIQCYTIDENGKIDLMGTVPQRNPAYVALSEDGEFLYAAEELFPADDPRVYAYKVGHQGGLTLINSQPLPGALACHLTVRNNCLVVASYGSGTTQVFPIDKLGALLPGVQQVKHQGKGPNLSRQEGPHAHMICAARHNLIYVVDLGIDQCKAYSFTASNVLEAVPGWDLEVGPGSGPRHMVAHPIMPWVSVLCELTGDVYTFDLTADRPSLLQKINSLPPSYGDTPSGAAIRLHPNGKYLYVSNRGCDTITQFEFMADGKLNLIDIVWLSDKTPRDFNISANGEVLIVGGMDSHTLSLFDLDKNTGKMEYRQTLNEVFSPSCICIFDRD